MSETPILRYYRTRKMTKLTGFSIFGHRYTFLLTFCFLVVALIKLSFIHSSMQKGIQTNVGIKSSKRSSQSCLFDIEDVEKNLHVLDQEDSDLIHYTRTRHLTPPSKLPYSLKGDGKNVGDYWKYVSKFFAGKRNGRFIEAGANDGETASQTLYLEKELDWKGLLIECNPIVTPQLRWKHRKAWVADVCLSTTNHVANVNFSNPVNWTFSGRIGKPWKLPSFTGSKEWTYFDVRAIPLYTILAAIGWTEVDYFLFDIEGQELNVFKTFLFEKISFKLLVVEVQFYNDTEKLELTSLLDNKGYALHEKLERDHVYVHKLFLQNFLQANKS